MTKATRPVYWPKRWLRSFAGAALATAVVGGAAWAEDPAPLEFPAVAKQGPKSEIPKVPALPKVEVPKVETPKAPTATAPKEKLVTFSMSDKPWKDVVDWYRDESGLAFNGAEKPPTGTYNFTPPKDPKTGLPRKYTLTEVTDLINEALLTKGFILVRGTQTFMLWPADKPIDPIHIRRVSLDELQTLAKRDLVQIVLPLKTFVASEQVNNVKKMMTTGIGDVVALEGGRNALILTDTAGVLRQIVRDLTSEDNGADAEMYQYTCKHVKARDAAAHVRDLIGAEGGQEFSTMPNDGGRGRGDRGRGGFPGGGFDPRAFGGGQIDPRMLAAGGQFDPRAMRGGFGNNFNRAGGKVTRVISDDATNSVSVSGPADKVSQAKTALTKFDVGTTTITIGNAEYKTYVVPAGTAETLAGALQQRFQNSSVGIQALSQNQIVVYAYPADQLDIIKWINDISKTSKEVTKNIEIIGMDVEDAETMLKAMFASQATGGPYIGKHPNGTSIVVRGKPEQVEDVVTALGKSGIGVTSDAGTGGPASPSANIRILNLKDGSAADLADAIRAYMQSMGYEGIKVIRPGGMPMPPALKPKLPDPREVPKKPDNAPNDGKKASIERGTIKTYGLGVRDLATTSLISTGDEPVEPAETKKKATSKSPLTITAVGDKIIITGADPKAVALAYDLARMVTTSKGEMYQVFRLNNANATEASRVLNEWFNGTQDQNQQQQNRNPFQFFGGRFGQQPPKEETKPRVRIVAEQSSNSLLVRANMLDLLTIKNLLDTVIDKGAGDSKAVVRPFKIGPLQYASATSVVDTIKEVFRENTNQAASQSTNGGFGGAFGGGFRGFGRRGQAQQPLDTLGRPKQVTLTIAADDQTNSIFGTATGEMQEDIEKMVKAMEEMAKNSTKVITLVPTPGIDPIVSPRRARRDPGPNANVAARRHGLRRQSRRLRRLRWLRRRQSRRWIRNVAIWRHRRRPVWRRRWPWRLRRRLRYARRRSLWRRWRRPRRSWRWNPRRIWRGHRGGGMRGGGSRSGSRRGPEAPPPGGLGDGGPDFFEQGDMEVPQQTLLYDPYEENLMRLRAGLPPRPSSVQMLGPVQLAGRAEPQTIAQLPDSALVQAKKAAPGCAEGRGRPIRSRRPAWHGHGQPSQRVRRGRHHRQQSSRP